jgi:DNA-binding GntR family transcriptional regulator
VASELATRLGVGLNVVRESLSVLDGAGLLDVLPNRGAVVKSLSRDDIAEIFQIREALEGQAACLAARNITRDGARQRLQEAFELADKAAHAGDVGTYRIANGEFHRAILEIAGNRRLIESATELTVPIYQLQLHLLLDGTALRSAAAGHKRIVDAILSGNATLAQQAMQAHIESAGLAMQRVVEAR